MNVENLLNENQSLRKINPDIRSFLINYACEDNSNAQDLTKIVEHYILKEKRSKEAKQYFTKQEFPSNIRTLADYRGLEKELKKSGRIIVNKRLQGLSNFLYDTLDKFIGQDKERYASLKRDDTNNESMTEFKNQLEHSQFNLFNYLGLVKSVQNQTKSFDMKGGLEQREYSLNLGDTTLRVEADISERYVTLEIENKDSTKLSFKINKDGKVIDHLRDEKGLKDLKVLEAYKPFLLQLNEDAQVGPLASGGYERTKAYTSSSGAPAASAGMVMNYR